MDVLDFIELDGFADNWKGLGLKDDDLATLQTAIIERRPAMKSESETVKRLRGFLEVLKSGEKISDRFTCRRVVLDLKPTVYCAQQVRTVRKSLGASQTVFALFLGVSVQTVRSWEQGTKTPSDIAARFMDEIRRDPDYWLRRISGAVVAKHS